MHRIVSRQPQLQKTCFDKMTRFLHSLHKFVSALLWLACHSSFPALKLINNTIRALIRCKSSNQLDLGSLKVLNQRSKKRKLHNNKKRFKLRKKRIHYENTNKNTELTVIFCRLLKISNFTDVKKYCSHQGCCHRNRLPHLPAGQKRCPIE